MQVEITLPSVIEKTDFKEMLSVRRSPEGKTVVKCNFSSLDIRQTCMRKAQLALHKTFQVGTEHAALTFGQAFHKAMEVWYSAPITHRRHGSVTCDDSQALMLSGQPPLPHADCARCAAVFAFLEHSRVLSENDGARAPENAMNILNNYFDVYLDDPFELLKDDMGPFCERSFEMKIFDGEMLGRPTEVWFFGTIDSILRNRATGEVIVADHKTTSSLGKDFFNRIKPNFQYTGYFWAAKEVFGLKPVQFMVNGVQVAKTKQEVARQFTSITDEEIEELRQAILWNVLNYLRAEQGGFWPMSTPSACSMWGGCTFKRVCELPSSLHNSMLSAEFITKKEPQSA